MIKYDSTTKNLFKKGRVVYCKPDDKRIFHSFDPCIGKIVSIEKSPNPNIYVKVTLGRYDNDCISEVWKVFDSTTYLYNEVHIPTKHDLKIIKQAINKHNKTCIKIYKSKNGKKWNIKKWGNITI